MFRTWLSSVGFRSVLRLFLEDGVMIFFPARVLCPLVTAAVSFSVSSSTSGGFLINPHALKRRMTHHCICGHFRKTNFAYEFRLQPGCCGFRGIWPEARGTIDIRDTAERIGVANKRFKLLQQFLLGFDAESCSNFAGVLKLFSLKNADEKRAKRLVGAFVIRKTSDHHLLALVGLNFQPFLRSFAGQIDTIVPLGYYAFKAQFPGCFESFCSWHIEIFAQSNDFIVGRKN